MTTGTRVASGHSARLEPRQAPGAWVLLVWMLAAAAAIALGVVDGPGTMVVALLFGGALYLLGARGVAATASDRVFEVRLFMVGFIARFAFTAILLIALGIAEMPGLEGGSDYLFYDSMSWRLAEEWRAGRLVLAVPDTDPGFFYMVAGVYAITGHHLIAPLLLNALFGAVTAVLVFRIGLMLFDRRTAAIAGVLAALLPTLLFWSSVLYKDVMLAAAVTWTTLLAVRLGKGTDPRTPLWLGLSLVPLFLMRRDVAMVLMTAIGAYVMLTRQVNLSSKAGMAIAAASLLTLLFSLQMMGVANQLDVLERFQNPVSRAFVHREAWGSIVEQRASGITRTLYQENLLLKPHLLVIAAGMMLLTPIPGVARFGMNFPTFLAPGQAVWLLLLPALAYGVLWVARNRTADRLFVLLLTAALALGVVVAGYFATPRYLVQMVPLFLVIAAVGVVRLRLWWHFYAGGVALVGSVAILYLLAR